MLTNLLKRSNKLVYGAMNKTNNISFIQIASKFFGNKSPKLFRENFILILLKN